MNLKKRYLEAVAADETLQEHDDKYHGGHFDEKTMTCGKRERQAGDDPVDSNLSELSDDDLGRMSAELHDRGYRNGDVLGDGGWSGVNFSQWDRDSKASKVDEEIRKRTEHRMEKDRQERNDRNSGTLTEAAMIAGVRHIFTGLDPTEDDEFCDEYGDDNGKYGNADPTDLDIDTIMNSPVITPKVLDEIAFYASDPGGFAGTDDESLSNRILNHSKASRNTKARIVRTWGRPKERWFSPEIAIDGLRQGVMSPELADEIRQAFLDGGIEEDFGLVYERLMDALLKSNVGSKSIRDEFDYEFGEEK